MLIKSSIHTVRDASPVHLGGKRVGYDKVFVTVEVTAIFSTDEAAAEYENAVRDLLEKA